MQETFLLSECTISVSYTHLDVYKRQDIGVHQDGLVHISEICDRYIKHTLEAVSVGDIVDVQVMSVDLKKQRIQLTMKIGQGKMCIRDSLVTYMI